MKAIQTNESTFNKKVKAKVLELIPGISYYEKCHVGGVGYVYFIKDKNGKTLGKVFKDFKGMKIYVD